jgi:hypothetical protein
MTENQQNISSSKSKKRSKLIIAFLFLTSILFFAVSLWIYNENKELKTNGENSIKNSKDIEAKISILNEILKIDELIMLEGEYQEGLENYKEILQKSGDEYLDIIQVRINNISQLLSDNQNLSKEDNEKNLIINKQNKQIENFQNQIDSLKNINYSNLDSLKKKIVSLNESIEKKEKLLNRKEKIKVLSFNNSKGGKIHYLGEVENEKASGGGIGIWTTGSIYKGDWKNNLRHGNGTFEWADGEKYIGEYVNDIRNGKGTYLWPSGERYEGLWKNDKRNGFGILYDRDSNIRFEGEWVDDKPLKIN